MEWSSEEDQRMTLVDAYRTGRRFRVIGSDEWMDPAGTEFVAIRTVDIGAWYEIEPEPRVVVTESALDDIFLEFVRENDQNCEISDYQEFLKKKLFP